MVDMNGDDVRGLMMSSMSNIELIGDYGSTQAETAGDHRRKSYFLALCLTLAARRLFFLGEDRILNH